MTINSKIVETSKSGVTINAVVNGANAGLLTLNGANTYTGATVVNGSNSFATNGHVVGNTIGDISSAFGAGGDLVLNGATLKMTPTAAQATSRNMSWNGNSAIVIANSNPAHTVTLNGSISGAGTFNVDQNAASGALVLAGDNDYAGEIQFQTDAKLVLANANALKNGTLNWAGQRVSATLSGNHAFNIGGLKGNAGDLDIGGGSLAIGSNNQSNAFLGSLSGSGGLIKKGGGTQTLIKNTFTGNTVVEEGALKLGSVSQTVLGTMTVSQDSTLVRARIVIAGSNVPGYAVGQVVKVTGQPDNEIWGIGYDTTNTYLYLKNALAAGAYSGSVEALKGSIASSTIEVKAGAYLVVSAVSGFSIASNQVIQGNGTVVGAMTVSGTLSPGSSPGTLHTDSQVWQDVGDYNWQVHDAMGAAGIGYDTIAINGTLDLMGLSAAGFGINLWSLSAIQPDQNGAAINFNNVQDHAWTILSTTDGILGFDAGDFVINTGSINGTDGFDNDLGGGSFFLSVSGDGKNLVLNFDAVAAPVPEPASLLLCGMGALIAMRRRR